MNISELLVEMQKINSAAIDLYECLYGNFPIPFEKQLKKETIEWLIENLPEDYRAHINTMVEELNEHQQTHPRA